MKLSLFQYNKQLRDYLKIQKKTWDWFSSVQVKEEQLLEFKTGRLKNTYRLDKEGYPELYIMVNQAKEMLGLTLDVTLYQAQNSIDNNAGISYVNGEAHLVLSGPIIKLLNGDEMLAVIAHELAHVLFFSIENAELEVADRIITSIANDYRSEDVYLETAKLFRLYMELFCDRASLVVTKDLNVVLAGLIKINTGLEKVSVEGYLKQADEIFASQKVKAELETHPENYIRVRALSLWNADNIKADEEIIKMIEGDIEMQSLDIFKQEKIKLLTFDLIKLMLKPKWIKTTAVLSLARQYDSNFKADENVFVTEELLNKINLLSNSVKEYLTYILLDFALVDPTLEDVPMGFAFQIAENLGLKENFNVVVKKELKLGDRKLTELHNKSSQAFASVNESTQEHIYEE
jgi:Peptidase family M48